VLVDVGERAEQVKIIAGGSPRHTPVRLRLLDSCPYRAGDPLNVASGLALEPMRVESDGKLGVVPVPGIARDAPPRCPDSMIERGTKILDHLPGEQRPVVAGSVPLDCETAVSDFLRRATLTVHAEHISVVVNEGLGLRAKCLDLFYAPRELPLSRTSHGGDDD
jgi:hypothetical protein